MKKASAKPRRSDGHARRVQPSTPPASRFDWHRPAAFAGLFLGLLLLTALVYQPAWHGGMLWDDDGHVTPPQLRSAAGLWRIWFEIGATQQYYPLVHSAFWLQHRLWGDGMFGYHLSNIALHALCAFLIVVILRRLRVPGAALAGAIFAVHPVHVESVAWISEMKNTLSGVFYLGAALAYLRFDDERRSAPYVFALVLFMLALASKTVAATLPAALLIVFWWQRGRLAWRRDVRPLLPFFVLGAGAGLVTAWVERAFIGARGVEFNLTLAERGLVAGRAFLFYLVKLAWPAHLVFMYPKWQVDAHAAWQYLFPLAVAALLGTLWLVRTRSRAPLAALLFFGATLAPGLGFVNVFPFRYSFVADHFQYLASVGVIALFAAGVATFAEKRVASAVRVEAIALVVLVAALGSAAWARSREFADADVLYRATLEANPSCWLAHNNLGIDLQRQGRVEEAAAQYRQALRIEPNAFEAHQNLGVALLNLGRPDEATRHVAEALRIRPEYPEAYNTLAAAQLRLGRYEDAIASARTAVRLKPDYGGAYANLGAALDGVGRGEQALEMYRRSVSLEPDSATNAYRLADALRRNGRAQEAIDSYRNAVRLEPGLAEAHNDLALALEGEGRLDEAMAEYQEAARLRPEAAQIQNNIGRLLLRAGRFSEAEGRFVEALRLRPDYGPARFNLGDVFVRTGRVVDGVDQYREALKSSPGSADTHAHLGTALALLGRLDEAVREFNEALRLKPDYAEARRNLENTLAVIRTAKRLPRP